MPREGVARRAIPAFLLRETRGAARKTLGKPSASSHLTHHDQVRVGLHEAHEFESWFPSSDAFDEQRRRGFVTCPLCDSPKVEKQIMAPRVARTDRTPETPVPQPVAVLSEKEREMRAMVRASASTSPRTRRMWASASPTRPARSITGRRSTARSTARRTGEARALMEEDRGAAPARSSRTTGTDPVAVYFTSDTHFGDPRVLRIDKRPFNPSRSTMRR
jgi:hypothetical protein